MTHTIQYLFGYSRKQSEDKFHFFGKYVHKVLIEFVNIILYTSLIIFVNNILRQEMYIYGVINIS